MAINPLWSALAGRCPRLFNYGTRKIDDYTPPSRPCYLKELSRARDRLDVVHAAAIPMRAEPRTVRCGEAVEQIGHWIVRTMRGDQVVARKCGPPITLAASDQDSLVLFIGEPIERLLDRNISAPPSLSSARIRKHVGPPFLRHQLLRMPPGLVLDCVTRLHHRGHQPRDVGKV